MYCTVQERESAECAHPKLIPNLQKRPEDGLLRGEGEEKVADPSSERSPGLPRVYAMLPKVQRGLVEEEPGIGLDAQTGIRFRIDMFPYARSKCRVVGCCPELPGLEMNQTIASWLAGAKFPPSAVCATLAYRRTACRSSRSNTCAQASLNLNLTPELQTLTLLAKSLRHPNCPRCNRGQGGDYASGWQRMSAMETLVIFDFDWSLIDCNSDTWVVEKLGAMERMKSFRDTLPWTQLMDRMMTELHNDGRTLDDIDQCLRIAPLEPEMVMSVKLAAEIGCELHIVSDANSHFIKEILDCHDLQQYFSQVHTNPAHLDENGALRVLPFHPQATPHCCKLCPPNMCKGLILDSIRHRSVKKRVIYIGDGGGDYCPSLRLTDEDLVLARQGFPLLKRLTTNQDLVRATVHEWTTAKDVEKLFRELLQTRHL